MLAGELMMLLMLLINPPCKKSFYCQPGHASAGVCSAAGGAIQNEELVTELHH